MWVQGTISEMEDRHLPKECRKVLETCRNAHCTAHIPRDAHEAHSRVCPFAIIPCEFCGHAFPRGEMGAHHASVCEMHPVSCPGQCGKEGLVRSTVMKHVDEECPKTLVACPVPMCAMSGKIERGLLRRHMDEAAQMHVEARFASLEATIRQQGAQIASLLEANAHLTLRLAPLDEFIAKESERVARERAERERIEREERAQREAEEAFARVSLAPISSIPYAHMMMDLVPVPALIIPHFFFLFFTPIFCEFPWVIAAKTLTMHSILFQTVPSFPCTVHTGWGVESPSPEISLKKYSFF